MVQDWFELKDVCPYALYDDQWRLYAALLRMQLRAEGKDIAHDDFMATDCLDICADKENAGMFVWCFGE
jgi:hypothetical protein